VEFGGLVSTPLVLSLAGELLSELELLVLQAITQVAVSKTIKGFSMCVV